MYDNITEVFISIFKTLQNVFRLKKYISEDKQAFNCFTHHTINWKSRAQISAKQLVGDGDLSCFPFNRCSTAQIPGYCMTRLHNSRLLYDQSSLT